MKTLKELKQFKNDFIGNFCDNTGCSGKLKDIRPVKMRKEFDGEWFYWCEKCREKDKDMIEKVI